MLNVDDFLDKLELHLLELEEKYIDIHNNPLESPEDFKLDIRSYCVLSHAAFEEFVENLCLYVLDEIEEKFANTQRISYSTLCLLHFNSNTRDIDDKSWKDDDRIFDYLLKEIKNIKSNFSKYIMDQNHGVGLKYLKKMLVPLGLYTSLDVKHRTALDNLSQSRGGYAHTSHRNIRSLSPEDARTQVRDVYEIMVELSNKSKAISYYSIN